MAAPLLGPKKRPNVKKDGVPPKEKESASQLKGELMQGKAKSRNAATGRATAVDRKTKRKRVRMLVRKKSVGEGSPLQGRGDKRGRRSVPADLIHPKVAKIDPRKRNGGSNS